MKLILALTIPFLLITACGKGTDKDDGAIVVKAEIPRPPNFLDDDLNSPAPEPTPEPGISWNQIEYVNDNFYVMIDRDGDGTVDQLPSGCTSQLRFVVSNGGRFSLSDSCTGYAQSGALGDSDFARINARMAKVTLDEANSNLKCGFFLPPLGYPGKPASITVHSQSGSFAVWRGAGLQVCFPNNKKEIAALHTAIWNTLKNIVTLDFAR